MYLADIINVLVYHKTEVYRNHYEEERDTLKEWNNKKVSRYYLELKISKIKDYV